ncbi:hypothetical protein ACIBH1_30395 [Nonomuraea sp. NPDC050663]|uniref:hypothetical protein n=1 Tax=Nonomuraea sp. NPDC050663 TaxID=3364370 RepID=UPI0037A998B2
MKPATPAKQPKSKASKAITLTIVGAVGVLMIGYCAAQVDDDDVVADCVDNTTQLPDGSYAVVDDDYCDNTTYRSGGGSAFLWYYAGTRIGARVHKGSTIRPSNVNITSRSGAKSIQRGGFGGRGSSGS